MKRAVRIFAGSLVLAVAVGIPVSGAAKAPPAPWRTGEECAERVRDLWKPDPEQPLIGPGGVIDPTIYPGRGIDDGSPHGPDNVVVFVEGNEEINGVRYIMPLTDSGRKYNVIYFFEAQPYISATNRTMLPLRCVAEVLGGTATWDGSTRTATVKSADGRVVTIRDPVVLRQVVPREKVEVVRDGASEARINGQPVAIDPQNPETKAVMYEGEWRIFLPFRFVAEALGYTVEWKPTPAGTGQVLLHK